MAELKQGYRDQTLVAADEICEKDRVGLYRRSCCVQVDDDRGCGKCDKRGVQEGGIRESRDHQRDRRNRSRDVARWKLVLRPIKKTRRLLRRERAI